MDMEYVESNEISQRLDYELETQTIYIADASNSKCTEAALNSVFHFIESAM